MYQNFYNSGSLLLCTVSLLFFALIWEGCKSVNEGGGDGPELWLTTLDQQALFERLEDSVRRADPNSGNPVITISTATTYQTMDGFGYTLTGGSALHLNNMDPAKRSELLNELFGTGEGSIGVSYLRVSIGSSDLDPAPFSYNDLPDRQTDEDMSEFSLDPDREYLIPMLKEILAIYPEMKIMGSPWSAPTWMKTNKGTIGGSLLPEYYDAYALYFVKYIQGMAAEGITIDAITVQNEPLHDGNNPSMYMTSEDQRDFVKNHLGPAFEEAGLQTKIVIWDHNADNPQYPVSILKDPEAKKYIDGSAFHLYGGDISALRVVHEAHPDKNLYFTEQWIGAPGNFETDLPWHIRNLIIGAPRNWSRNVLQWNLAADPNQNPHTQGGCDRCLGALTIDGNEVTRNPSYYIVAHASKFVRPGSVRIQSNLPEGLPNAAFKNPDGEVVVIVMNDTGSRTSIDISVDGDTRSLSLLAGAVGTIVWK